MSKKLFVILLAGLLLVSAVACGKDDPKETETQGDTKKPAESYIVIGTDESGNTVTTPVEPDTTNKETKPNPSEENPTFVDVQKEIVVITAVATVRSSTIVSDSTGIGWPSEGTTLTVTGESTNWYRIRYNDADAYIAKSTVADAAGLEGFTPVDNEQITIATGIEGGAVNVRSYPSSDSTASIRGTLKEGSTATRVAVGEKWSIILFEVVSETETDAEGNAVKNTKRYYISNDCIKTEAAETAETGETEASSAAN